MGFRMELVQGATPICEGSCHLTPLRGTSCWNDCKSCKVRVGSNGNSLWEASVLLGRKKVKNIFRMRNGDVEVCGYAFWANQYTSGFHGVNEQGREDVREVFQQRGSGAKRKLSRCGRNQMGNEPILALPEGADDFVVYYDARSKDLEACLEKGEGDCLYVATTEVLMPRVVKSRDEIFSRWGYCDNRGLSRLDPVKFVKFCWILLEAKHQVVDSTHSKSNRGVKLILKAPSCIQSEGNGLPQVCYEVSVSAEGVEELKRKVKIKGEKKEALLTLRILKDGGEVKEFQRSFRHSDTERLSRSDEVLKLKNFKKDATLKLFKSTNQERYEHVGPEVTRSHGGKIYKMAKRDYAWLMISRCSRSHSRQAKEQAQDLKSMITTSNHKIND
ncbi:hypothetical protein Tco_0328675 [Tanacetum coccineum]